MKKLGILLSVAILVFVLAPVGPAAGQEKGKVITMRLSHELPPTHQLGRAGEKFAEMVSRQSQGRLRVEIYPNAQLYKDKVAPDAVSSGAVESAFTPAIYLSSIIPLMGIYDVPMLFGTHEVVYKFFDSPEGHSLLQMTEKKGLKSLPWWHYGFGQFYSAKRPLKLPEDFRGQKMRVNDEIIGATVKALGGTPVFLSASEMYMALQRGTIEGMHTGISSMVERKLYEVSKYGSDDNHNAVPYTVSINLKFWNSLPKDLQEVLFSSAKEAGLWTRGETERVDQEYIKIIKEKGFEWHILTPEEREAWEKACDPVYEIFKKKAGKKEAEALINKAIEIKASLRGKK